MYRGIGILTFLLIASMGCNNEGDLTETAFDPEAYVVQAPPGYPQLAHPEDNQPTVQGVALGRALFYDPIMSVDGSKACASCHLQQGSFTDNTAFSEGVNNQLGKRSSMSLLDVGYNFNGLFWDGRSPDLEDQALHPIEDPVELAHTWTEVVADLRAHAEYPKMFREAFGIDNKDEITRDLAVKAIAQFERSLVSSGNSKYDRVVRNLDVFTDLEADGHDIYFDESIDLPDGQCFHCHSAPNFSDNLYHNNGLDRAETYADFPDLGRGAVTGIEVQNGLFRTTTLRNIEMTAPYMHDGRFETLEEVLDHYISGGHPSPNKSPFLDSIDLTNYHKEALLAFLKTLTDEDFLSNQEYSDPN